MTIYLWEIPETYPEKLIGRYERERSPDRFLFESGRVLDENEVLHRPTIKYDATKNQLMNYDCLVNSAALPLVNERVMGILMGLADFDIQLFDVTIECKDGELMDYKLVNVTNITNALDSDKSIYSIRELPRGNAMISNIKKLGLRSSCMNKHHLTRDDDVGHLLVSQAVHDAFKREKITGVWLTTPDEFYARA